MTKSMETVPGILITIDSFGAGSLGNWGRYIVPICLLLFAFSTSIAWSYYGDRAVTYLLGPKWVTPFRVLFVICYLLGSFMDTTILWIFSGVTIAFMTLPNLLGVLFLHKEVKRDLKIYWENFRKDHPNEDAPKK